MVREGEGERERERGREGGKSHTILFPGKMSVISMAVLGPLNARRKTQ